MLDKKTIIFVFTVVLLVLSSVLACPPTCPDCQYWDGDSCENEDAGEAPEGQCEGTCHTGNCSDGECGEDDSVCDLGCDSCIDGECAADNDECTEDPDLKCKHVTSPAEEYNCVECLDDDDCIVEGEKCDTTDNVCKIDCSTDPDLCDAESCAPTCVDDFCEDDDDLCGSGCDSCDGGDCVADDDECDSGQVCKDSDFTCVECLINDDCEIEGEVCDTEDNVCKIDCSADATLCGEDSCAPECVEGLCEDDDDLCGTGCDSCDGGECVADDDECSGGELCKEDDFTCVECLDNGDCTDEGEVCDLVDNVCKVFCDTDDTLCDDTGCAPDCGADGYCEDDDSRCTGDCHDGCDGGDCVDDDEQCGDCETCESGDCDSDCTTSESVCNTDSDTCVQCLTSGDCTDPLFPACDASDHICIADCSSCLSCEVCDTSSGSPICVPATCPACQSCGSSGSCEDDDSVGGCSGCQTCSSGSCVDDDYECDDCENCNSGTCQNQCTGTSTPLCYTGGSSDTCVECLGSSDCTDSSYPNCEASTHQCVAECGSDPDCTGCEVCDSGSCVDDDAGCDPCNRCSYGSCVIDDTRDTGRTDDGDCGFCQKCSGGACVDDSCDSTSCEDCDSTDGECVDRCLALSNKVCDYAGMCVECIGDSDCDFDINKTKCDYAYNVCVECRADGDCGTCQYCSGSNTCLDIVVNSVTGPTDSHCKGASESVSAVTNHSLVNSCSIVWSGDASISGTGTSETATLGTLGSSMTVSAKTSTQSSAVTQTGSFSVVKMTKLKTTVDGTDYESTTATPGASETIYVPLGDTGDTITLTAELDSSGGSSWPSNKPSWTGSGVTAGTAGQATFAIDTVSTDSDGTQVEVSACGDTMAFKIVVVGIASLETEISASSAGGMTYSSGGGSISTETFGDELIVYCPKGPSGSTVTLITTPTPGDTWPAGQPTWEFNGAVQTSKNGDEEIEFEVDTASTSPTGTLVEALCGVSVYKIRFIIVDLNMTFTGVSDDDEVNIGGYISLNDNDTDNDGLLDIYDGYDADATVPSDDDSIPDEVDLKALSISLAPSLDTGIVKLEVNTANMIRLWKNPEKGKDNEIILDEITLSKEWDLSDSDQKDDFDDVCRGLHIEGVSASADLKDIELKISYIRTLSYTVTVTEDIIKLTVFNADIDVDSDRNGTVSSSSNEEVLEESTPAIMLVNIDDDDNDGEEDCINNVIDNAEDAKDLAHLKIQKGLIPPGGKVVLKVDEKDILRIFDGNATSATAKVGGYQAPTVDSCRIPDADFTSGAITYYVEGIWLPGASVPEKVVVTLTILDSADKPVSADEVTFQPAPFILLPGTAVADTFYVGNRTPKPNKYSVFVDALKGALSSTTAVEVNTPSYGYDKWHQDEVEIGYTQWPNPNLSSNSMNVVFDLPRNKGLDPWPEAELHGPDYGFFEYPGTSGSREGGNIEVTPPITINSKYYPQGIIVTGKSSNPLKDLNSGLKDFFKAQKVQVLQPSGEFVQCETGWLGVGHIDEVISFIPSGSGFKVLIADTTVAMTILDDMNETYSGRTNSATNNTLTDDDATWTSNKWQDGFIEITSGTGIRQVRKIASNSTTSITVSNNWTIPLDSTSEFTVTERSAYRAFSFEGYEDYGLVSSATSTTLTVSGKNWPNLANGYVYIADGAGIGQYKKIVSNTSTELTFGSTWSTLPDSTSRYVIVETSKKWIDITGTEYRACGIVKQLCGSSFRSYQATMQANIDAVRTELKNGLGLSDTDFIEIPVLFDQYSSMFDYRPDTVLPNMVNSLIAEGKILIPKPFGPKDSSGEDQFEKYVKSKITTLTEVFIDDWETYHAGHGEIHCGTNVKRNVPSTNWWD